MVDVPLVPLSFIAGPAVLANACAIMQNGASIRYNLAVQQLRELRTRAQETTLPSLYEDPRLSAQLSETRELVLLRQLELLLTSAWLFGLTSVLAAVSSTLAERQSELAAPSIFVTIGFGGVGLALLLRASLGFRSECMCSRQLVRLHSRTELEDASTTPRQH